MIRHLVPGAGKAVEHCEWTDTFDKTCKYHNIAKKVNNARELERNLSFFIQPIRQNSTKVNVKTASPSALILTSR